MSEATKKSSARKQNKKAPSRSNRSAAKNKPAPSPKPAAAAKPRRISAIDAAAKLLAQSGKPMRPRDLIDQMAAKGLWKSPGGKTPDATLNSAIIREIAAKGKGSRFKKAGRGLYAAAPGGAGRAGGSGGARAGS